MGEADRAMRPGPDGWPEGAATAFASAAAIRSATRVLVHAATTGDAEAIERAVASRGTEIARLRRLFEAGAVDDATRRRLVEQIALDAGEADRALRRTAEASRGDLDRLKSVGRAFRGYDAYRTAASSLDRSG